MFCCVATCLHSGQVRCLCLCSTIIRIWTFISAPAAAFFLSAAIFLLQLTQIHVLLFHFSNITCLIWVHSPTNLHEQVWCIFLLLSITQIKAFCFSTIFAPSGQFYLYLSSWVFPKVSAQSSSCVLLRATCYLLIVSTRRLSSAFESVTMPVHIFNNFSILDIDFSASCCLLLSAACFAFSLRPWFERIRQQTYTNKPGTILFLQYQSHKSRCFTFPLLFTHHLRAFERTNLHEQSWSARILNHSPPPMTCTYDVHVKSYTSPSPSPSPVLFPSPSPSPVWLLRI